VREGQKQEFPPAFSTVHPVFAGTGGFGLAWDVYREMSGSHGEFVIDGNMVSVEYADQLKTLHVPTLVMAGEDDPVTLGILKEIHTSIVGSQLVVLPRTKHFTFVDQTQLFNQAVEKFVHP
jgi:pimeloyl-ACP methyl ester carboxylesterase